MSNNTKSKYATKRDAGQQMYGPGCCAHKVTDAQIHAAKERARKRLDDERRASELSRYLRAISTDGDCVVRS